MKITLIRHGSVEEAYQGCYNGHIEIGLSQAGREEAVALAETLQGVKFDRVYCSDLRRARETIAPFEQEKDAIYTAALREKSWGRHEGMHFDAIIAEGEIEYKNFIEWIEALDGEDYREYISRVEQFFLEFLLQEECDTILVLTHAGVIRTLISIVQNISLEEAFSVAIPYGGYMVFDTESGSFESH